MGWLRADSFANKNELNHFGFNFEYTAVDKLEANKWSLSGLWRIDREDIVSQDDSAKLILNYNAKEVYIVAGSDIESKVKITSNGQTLTEQKGLDIESDSSTVSIKNSRLYKIIKHSSVTNGQIEMTVPKGVRLNAFTFGK